MDMLQAILSRRSVRLYTDDPIPEDTLHSILCAGLAAASSKNRRPWEFVVVRDRHVLDQLCDCRVGAANLLGKCSIAIVVCADADLVDVWVEDCGSAMTQMHLMADALGVGSCWLQVRLRQAADGRDAQSVVRGVLGIPEKYGVMAILTLGMPASHPEPHAQETLPWHKVHHDRFSKE
ncbi:MAG: nitroreductase family protein [Clostridia bacterium]|nr:nitroreductase family protein [Clostridia bacterium]